jgi:hypothetical protein
MMVARWQLEARFGHKQNVIDSLKKWFDEIGSEIGWSLEKVRITTGSVGALESSVVAEINIENLTELDDSWTKLGKVDGHKAWSVEIEPFIVSGTAKWEVFRVV